MRVRAKLTAVATVAIVVSCASAFQLLSAIDNRLLDAEFQLLRSWFPRPASHEVVVVGSDEQTIRRFPEPVTLWHRHLADFLAAMMTAGASVVGIDIVLPDRSFDSVMPGSDRALLKSMLDARAAYPLILAVTVDEAGAPRRLYPPYVSLAGPRGWGYALYLTDLDGKVRRFDERLGAAANPVPTLTGQMARRLGVEPRAGWIDYWHGEPFHYVPLHQVLEWAKDGKRDVLKSTFGGKPVLLGTALPFTDRVTLPAALAGWEASSNNAPGVVLHAQVLRTLLAHGTIQSTPGVVIFIGVMLTALLWFAGKNPVVAVLALCAIEGALFVAATALVTYGIFFPIGAPMLSAALALGGRSAMETASKLHERKRLRKSFAGYVSPSVMEEILMGRVSPELGGSGAFVCVLFSDIRGYTARAEGMSPQDTIQFLNRYFDEVVHLIHDRGGSVTSFMGDGIMAVFGAPNRLENPCRSAVDAGADMLRYIADLNDRLQQEGGMPIDIGIGIDAGEAVIGHVGSCTRHDYTAIGDVVNVASRIESLTKETGFRMVVSAAVAHHTADSDVPLVRLGPMAIKGHTPVEIYGYGASEADSAPSTAMIRRNNDFCLPSADAQAEGRRE